MRYAPTPVRLRFGLDWGMGELRFRSLQGVCDTPLHLFDENEHLSNENIMSNQPNQPKYRSAEAYAIHGRKDEGVPNLFQFDTPSCNESLKLYEQDFLPVELEITSYRILYGCRRKPILHRDMFVTA